MHKVLSAFLIASGMTLGAAGAMAANCTPPAEPEGQGIRFLLGIQPSDGILDVWCRIQAVPGNYRVNVLFPAHKAHRSFEASFDGSRSRPKEELANFIRSLLPTKDGKMTDEQGMAFPAVLGTSVQAQAPEAPDGQGIGVPKALPGSDVIALWEPVVLRVRPLKIADAEFTLLVTFRPSAARFLMGLTGSAERFQVQGYKSRVLGPDGVSGCPKRIPSCDKLPEVVSLDTAWIVDSVKLEASGGGLSRAAATVLGQLVEDNRSYVGSNTMQRFSAPYGEGEVNADDGVREVLALATGDLQRAAGTQTIEVLWRERRNSKGTYATNLADWLKQVREQLVYQYGAKQATP